MAAMCLKDYTVTDMSQFGDVLEGIYPQTFPIAMVMISNIFLPVANEGTVGNERLCFFVCLVFFFFFFRLEHYCGACIHITFIQPVHCIHYHIIHSVFSIRGVGINHGNERLFIALFACLLISCSIIASFVGNTITLISGSLINLKVHTL